MSRFTFWLLLFATANAQAAGLPLLPLEKLKLPPGYQIEVVARVPDARQMAVAGNGVLFVGSRRAGRVVALADDDGDGRYDRQYLIADGLPVPSGIALRGQDLYVAALDRVLRFPGAARHPHTPPEPVTVTDRLPDKQHHGWKYLKFGPDGMLYLNVGAPCNICRSTDPRFASLLRIAPDTGREEIYAAGVRNSVGFAWHPQDYSMWFTDNGRDHLGDDLPDDELNRADRAGLHFGYPFMHGQGLADPLYGAQHAGPFQPPVLALGAHVAPLGLTFYHGNQFPDATSDTLFIAEHGSWNRSLKVGYRIVKVETRAGRVVSHTPFISGWLQGQRHWGRPVDVVNDHDGSLLISDDFAGAIYRVRSVPR
jgi:glucose/arabinose dehydrogenase